MKQKRQQASNFSDKKNQLVPDEWVSNYADLLFRFVQLRLANNSLAEDIVQETFLNAWKSRATYNHTTSEKNWLFAICKNKIIDHYRSLKINATVVTDDHFFDNEDHWTATAAPRDWNITDLPAGRTEFYEVLSRCQHKLNSTQQAVFTLKYLDAMETQDICSSMNISLQNYWVLMHRAKLQLRECLQINWINL